MDDAVCIDRSNSRITAAPVDISVARTGRQNIRCQRPILSLFQKACRFVYDLDVGNLVGRPAYGVMVTSQVSFTVGSSTDSTVIIAVPLLPIAVTRPLLSTLTIVGSDEVHFRL